MSALDERIKYYRVRIINRLKGYERDIGPTFRLYIDTVMECENLDELKEMAELDLQLDYFNYIRSINDKLQIFGVSLDDIKRENDKNVPKDNNEITELLKNVTDEDIAALDDSDETYSNEYDNYMDNASEADEFMSKLGMLSMYTSGDDESLDGIEGLPSEFEDNTDEVEYDADEDDEYFDAEYDTDEVVDDYEEENLDDFPIVEEESLDISDDAEIDLGQDDEEGTDTDSENLDDIENEEDDEYFGEDDEYFGESSESEEFNTEYDDDDDDEYFGDSEVVAFVENEVDESVGGETSEEDDDFLNDFEGYLPQTEENSEENDEDLYFGDETDEFDEYGLNEEDDDDDYFGDNSFEETDNEENEDYTEDEEDDYFDVDYETDSEYSEEELDDDESDDDYFGDIDSSMDDSDFAEEFEDDASDDDDLFFGDIDDTDSEEDSDLEDEDDDLFFGDIEDDEGTIEDELDRQIAEFESGAMDDDDIFGGLDDGSDTGTYEMSPTGFVKGSIFDQYATEKGYVAFGNMKTEAMYQGIASFISKGTSKVEGEIKNKFGKFFDLG